MEHQGELARQTIDFVVYGVQVKIKLFGRADELVEEMRGIVPNGTSEPDPARPFDAVFAIWPGDQSDTYGVQLDGESIGIDVSAEGAVGIVNLQCARVISSAAPKHLLITGSAVAVAGKAIVVVADGSFAGTSTLAQALVEQGATFLSDGFAVLDDSGRAYPYDSPTQAAQRQLPGSSDQPASTNPASDNNGFPVGVLAMLRYEPDSPWNADEVPAGTASLELIARAVSARERPAAVMTSARRAAEPARCVRGIRGEASDAAARLMALTRDA